MTLGQLFCLRKSSPFQHCHFCHCSIVAILDWIWLSFFVAQPSESIIYQKSSSSSSSSSSSRANLLFQTSSSSLACSLHDFCYFSKPPHCHRRLPCCIPRIAFDFLLLVLSTVLGWLPFAFTVVVHRRCLRFCFCSSSLSSSSPFLSLYLSYCGFFLRMFFLLVLRMALGWLLFLS